MNRRKPFISLAAKMAMAVTIGIGLALCVLVACLWLEDTVTQKKYLSDKAVQANVGAAYDSLQAFIAENDVPAADTKALSEWLKDQEYTYLFVYDNYSNIFEGGMWVTTDEDALEENLTELDTETETDTETKTGKPGYESKGNRIDHKTFEEDIRNRIVDFADGPYYVYIEVYKEYEWQKVMGMLSVVLSLLTLLATILIYNGHLLQRVASLSSNIQKVSDGDLEHEVVPLRNDELGALAVSVDNMRNSIIRKHQNEREAWEANQQLITEMSHDIRTPLTSLIGYLDIIEGKKYHSTDELDKYVSACRDKAFQLKDLSDKLFQYFLVYGSQAEKELEKFDGSILFQQLLMEHGAEIIGYGYKVDFIFSVPEVDVLVDLSGIRRVFNNIFSNVMKYADHKEPVVIEAMVENGQIVVVITNTIAESAKKVESNKIGLKTCEKICKTFNGKFVYAEQDKRFISWVHVPVVKAEPDGPREEYSETKKEQS